MFPLIRGLGFFSLLIFASLFLVSGDYSPSSLWFQGQLLTFNTTVYLSLHSFILRYNVISIGSLTPTPSPTHLQIAVTYAGNAWVGLGFPSSAGTMVPATAVLGWYGSSNNHIIDNYDLTDYSVSGVIGGSNKLALVSSSVATNNSETTILFTRSLSTPLATYASITLGSASNIIYSAGSTPSSSSSSPQEHFIMNGQSITFTHAMATISTAATAATAASAASAASAGGRTVTSPHLLITGGSGAAGGKSSGTSIASSGVVYVGSSGGSTNSFVYCVNIGAGFVFCWTTLSNGLTQFSASYAPGTESGWVGLAFSPDGTMQGSAGVIGWSSGDNTYIDSYDLSENPRGVTPGSPALGVSSMSVSTDANGLTTLLFTALTPASTSSQNIIGACGPLPSSPSDPPSQHFITFSSVVDFSAGTATAASDPNLPIKQRHGLLMSIAWCFLLPLGIVIARYGKGNGPLLWFWLHRLFVIAALMLMMWGFALGLSLNGTNSFGTHGQIGIAIVALALFQPINVAFRPHAPSPGENISLNRRLWNYLHHLVGRVTFILAIVNCYIGANLLSQVWAGGNLYLAFFTSVWVLIILTAFFLEFYRRMYEHDLVIWEPLRHIPNINKKIAVPPPLYPIEVGKEGAVPLPHSAGNLVAGSPKVDGVNGVNRFLRPPLPSAPPLPRSSPPPRKIETRQEEQVEVDIQPREEERTENDAALQHNPWINKQQQLRSSSMSNVNELKDQY